MRPAVLLFAPLLLLPFVGCESNLTEPEPDASVTQLEQPPSAESLYQLGPHFGGEWWDDKKGFGYSGPHGDAGAASETALEGQHTATQARTRKGDNQPDAEPYKGGKGNGWGGSKP